MTLIRKTNSYPTWSNLFNEFLNQDWNDWSKQDFAASNCTLPSVNVKEHSDGFEVEMAAPGLNRNDFRIELNNSILTIKSEKKEEKESENDKFFSRREFSYQSFSRSFTLPQSIESDKIEAQYKDGILKISIPKREEAKPRPLRQIAIS